MSSKLIMDKCEKCNRDKQYDHLMDVNVCPVCDIIWDAEVWDKLRDAGLGVMEQTMKPEK